MGNRAVVVFKDQDFKAGVYLHWNGGPESVLAFLKVMEERKWTRLDYASARFTAVVSEFFDAEGECDGLSLAIVDDPQSWKDGCDNGLYEVSRDGDNFEVKQRGRKISATKLDPKDKEKMDQIVDRLAEIRSLRKSRKDGAK